MCKLCKCFSEWLLTLTTDKPTHWNWIGTFSKGERRVAKIRYFLLNLNSIGKAKDVFVFFYVFVRYRNSIPKSFNIILLFIHIKCVSFFTSTLVFGYIYTYGRGKRNKIVLLFTMVLKCLKNWYRSPTAQNWSWSSINKCNWIVRDVYQLGTCRRVRSGMGGGLTPLQVSLCVYFRAKSPPIFFFFNLKKKVKFSNFETKKKVSFLPPPPANSAAGWVLCEIFGPILKC